MAAVHIGIGHDDDAVVAQLGDVVLGADARAERGDQGGDLLRRDQLVEPCLLDIQHLAAQWQDGLELAIAALFSRAARGITLDDEQLGFGRVLFLAIGKLTGEADTVQKALSTGHVARSTGGLATPCCVDDLVADDARICRILLQVVLQRARDHLVDRPTHLGTHQFVLGLRREARLGNLDRQHAGQAFAHVIAGHLDLRTLCVLVLVEILVDHPRHGGTQSGQVRATVALRDVVGEAQNLVVVATVPLHRDIGADGASTLHLARRACTDHGRVNDGLGLVDVLDEALDATGKREILLLALALVEQTDAHSVVQERELAKTLGEDLVVELDRAEYLGRCHEVDLGAALVGLAHDLERRNPDAVVELYAMDLTVAPHRQAQPVRQRIHDRHPDAMQTARNLVAVLIELAARMQFGHHDLGGGTSFLVVGVHIGGDSAAIVGDRDGIVGVNRDHDLVAMTSQGLVDRVVDDLEHHVMQPGTVAGVADVHSRPLAHGLQPLEHADGGRPVVVGSLLIDLGGNRVHSVLGFLMQVWRRSIEITCAARCASASRHT